MGFLSLLGWDGGLPLLVALAPLLFRLAFPARDLEGGAVVIVAPVLACLCRAHHGIRQFEIRGIRPTGLRQLLFVIAILILLLFEIISGALGFAAAPFFLIWIVTGWIYCLYLGVIALALRPSRKDRRRKGSMPLASYVSTSSMDDLGQAHP